MNSFVICTPPDSHIKYIKKAIANNAHIFVEKPFSNTLDGVDEVITGAKKKNLILQVGYQFRFHPGLRLTKQLLDEGRIGKLLSIRAEFGYYLPYWHRQEDYRNLYVGHSKEGGGILLDASHEVQYICWLANSYPVSIFCQYSKISNLDIDTEDNADIILKFPNNITANIHLDMINRTYTRYCELVGEKGTLKWNFKKDFIELNTEKISFTTTDPYLEEIRDFIDCCLNKKEPSIDGQEGVKILRIILSAKQSGLKNTVIKVS